MVRLYSPGHPGGRVRSTWTSLNELWYGIQTPARGEHVSAPEAEAYVATGYRLLRRTARLLRPEIEHGDVFYDLGCGKGRVLAVMSRLPFARLVGVEIDPELAEAARENMRRLRGHHAPIEIECANALDVDLDDGTVFFLFNPFGKETMRRVIGTLRDSLVRKPRRVIVVYHNAAHASLLDEAGFLQHIRTLPTPGGVSVMLWRSDPVRVANPQVAEGVAKR